MTYIQSYKELIVWQKSIRLVEEVFNLSNKFPASELYGLTSQMRRASIAIPANIAEGYGRNSSKEYLQFYSIAYGSALELETHLIIAGKLNFANTKDFDKINSTLEEVLRLLHSMKIKLRQLNAKRSTTKRSTTKRSTTKRL